MEKDFLTKAHAGVTVDGCIAMEHGSLVFYGQPVSRYGLFSGGNVWYGSIRTEGGTPAPAMESDKLPRRCRLRIDVGEESAAGEVPETDDDIKAILIRERVSDLAELFDTTEEDMAGRLGKVIPSIGDYLKRLQ